MRTRAFGMGLAVALLLGAGGWAVTGTQRAANAAETVRPMREVSSTRRRTVVETDAPQQSVERAHAPARLEPHAPRRASSARDVQAPHGPRSLDEVELNARQQAWLDQLSPLQRTVYEYKLGLLDRMRACAGDLGDVHGKISAFLHFRADPAVGFAEALEPEVLDSSLPEDLDAAALRCVREAHAGSQLDLGGEHAGDGGFHWATDIVFPLDEDPAYELFALTDDDSDEEEDME